MANILIVDDNDEFREMLRKVLEKDGHTVSEAHDGKEGIKIYKEHPADLIMLDILMPEIDGIQTMFELKRDFDNVRFIIMSGGGEYTDAESYLSDARALSNQKTLSKPFTREELTAAIDEVLGKT